MMQPKDEDTNSEEHEIIFDGDDDSVEQKQSHSAPGNAQHHFVRTIESSEQQLLANFQPLKAIHSNEAVTASMRLESFLSSEYNDADIVSTGPHLAPNTGIITHTGGNAVDTQSTPRDPLTSPSLMKADSALLQQGRLVHPVTRSIHPIGISFFPSPEPTKFTPPAVSLFDDVDDTYEEKEYENDVELTYSRVSGSARFLEMEEEPSETTTPPIATSNIYSIFDPIQTSSGLLLTHRRIPPPQSENFRTQIAEGTASKSRRRHPSNPAFHSSTHPSFATRFEELSMWQSLILPKFPSSFPPLMRYIRLWVSISTLILFFGTALLLHHSLEANSESSSGTSAKNEVDAMISFHEENGIFTLEGLNDNSVQLVPFADDALVPDQIILLPLPASESRFRRAQHRRLLTPMQVAMEPVDGEPDLIRPEDSLVTQRIPRFTRRALGALTPLNALVSEFEAWKIQHDKVYHSKDEHHRRFQIWSDNHHRTAKKNARHGPCQLTGKPVFGVNQFHDLTPEEFQSQYLNGYHLKREPIRKGEEPVNPILGVHVEPPQLHPLVRDRLLEQKVHGTFGLDYQGNCKWYDVSCILRYLFSTFLYGLGGTMEPAYDANSYPTSIDWRSLGAVTDVHSQGSCGACWAITAVETVESAYFLSTGQLYDLAETEVIVCETKCEMCAGGWPQEAFDYIIAHNGLPLESDMTYNADFLSLVSEHVAGNSDELDDTTVSTYQQQTCPSGGGGNDHHSGDSQSISGSNTYTRYGKIKGYGYSTEKCVCYTDGSGCDCDHQNEGYAVRNLATYGPAVVCLDASTWQDYTEGIITSESGCSAGFMDVNHCVQAVGYAYMSDAEYQNEMDGKNSGDNNHNSKDGSRDSTQRKGYWIVRNQWSRYWGMNGYAYVAMGENTCGILNDMMQAYT